MNNTWVGESETCNIYEYKTWEWMESYCTESRQQLSSIDVSFLSLFGSEFCCKAPGAQLNPHSPATTPSGRRVMREWVKAGRAAEGEGERERDAESEGEELSITLKTRRRR